MDLRIFEKVMIGQEEADKCLVVSNIPPNTTEQELTIHFQKSKHGGGDIKSVSLVGKETALIVFDEFQPVDNVLSKQQNFKENILKTEGYSKYLSANNHKLTNHSAQVNDVYSMLGPLEGDQEQRSLVVQNLPQNVTEHEITIHFQKSKNGGGDVQKVKMIRENVAVVTFDEREPVKTCLEKKQELNGNELVLTVYQHEEEIENIDEDVSLINFDDEDEGNRSVLVKNLPQNVTLDEVHIHFQKRKNNGGDIEKVKFLNRGSAVITFYKSETASRALSTKQVLKGVTLHVVPVRDANPSIEVYAEVTASLNLKAFSFLDPNKLKKLLHWIQEQLQIRVKEKNQKFLLNGSFLQIKHCNSFLQRVLCEKNSSAIFGDSISESDDTASTEKGGRSRAGSSGKPKRDIDDSNQTASQRNSSDERHVNSTERVDSFGSLSSTGAELGPSKDLVQTFEINPIMIRFVRKVYEIEVIEQEYSVKLIESDDHNKITVQPQRNCNKDKYNDACSKFIDVYKNGIQGVTTFELSIGPDKNISKESTMEAFRNMEETLPVLVERGQDVNSWIIFGDRDSVSAAREGIQKMLGICSDKEKSRPRRAQATSQNRSTATDSSSDLPGDDKKDVLAHTSKSGIKLFVFRGDITEQHVDAIVVPANKVLSMKYGLGQTIIRKGGSSIQDEADKKNLVKPGSSVTTKAGSLPCKNIIHAVGPSDWPGKSIKEQQKLLCKAYLESFKLASSLKVQSIAVAAIGTGLVGVPYDVSASQLFNAVEEFWGRKKSEVKEIRIVNLKDEVHIAFKKEFEKRFKSNQSKPANAKTDGADKGQTSRADSGKPNSSESKTLDLPSKAEKTEEKCVICIDKPKNPTTLEKCGHKFCKDCIEEAFSHRKVCPTCGTVYGMLTGNQPNGTMNWHFNRYRSLPGYEGYGTIEISYYIPNGTQGREHPSPGQWYYGTSRTAYLPDCQEGREVLQLLRRAFDARLIFTIGTSVTTGSRNVVTWNDIHHKTNTHGGSTGYGYPDPTYLSRVKEELAAKGIV